MRRRSFCFIFSGACCVAAAEAAARAAADKGKKGKGLRRDAVRDVSHWLRLPPVRVFGKTIDVRRHVEHQLDVTFYNLNTVALFDWQTYGEMRNLALDKYGLELMETHLPAQTLEQGN